MSDKQILDASGVPIPVANSINKAQLIELAKKSFIAGSDAAISSIRVSVEAAKEKGHAVMDLEGFLKLLVELEKIVQERADERFS